MSDVRSWTQPNLFGTIAQNNPFVPTNVDFIPLDDKGDIMQIKGGEAVWRGLNTAQMQYWAYCFCSPLASVIDRLADADINGKFRVIKENKESSNSASARRLKKLFASPNPLQNYHEWRAQQVTYKKIYGYALVYAMNYSLEDRTTSSFLWNLDPFFCEPVKNDKFDIYKSPNPIKEWKISIFGQSYTIPAEKILIIKDNVLGRNADALGLPISKTAGLDWSVSNICAAMEADNVLLRKKGPLGFISQDNPRDPVAGYIPLTPKQKIEIQQDLSKYGMTWTQWQYVVTRHIMKWNPMSFNVRDLDTKGTIREGVDMICDRYGYPAELMSGKNATYENRTSAERYLYNSVVIPQNRRDFHAYSMWFGLIEDEIVNDFNDYPALQDNKVSQGESVKYNTEALHQQFLDGVISLNKYRQEMKVDTVEGDDKLYYGTQEYITKYGTQNVAPKNKAA